MSTLNKCLFIGNLTRDVELARTGSDLSVCNFTIAVSSRSKEPDAAPLFLECTAWRQSAEFLTQNATKGDQLMVEGHLENQAWADRETGKQRTKIILQVHTLELVRRATPKPEPSAAGPTTRQARTRRTARTTEPAMSDA